MYPELLEIQPQELKFTFELKKQSSCSVRLVNKSDEYVAFKVKTTNPKRYCVRPNTGIVQPSSACEFTVTMQAQRAAPPDMQFKDKFLVQSTIVPFGTTDEEIVASFFSKENGRYIEEHKLRVVLSPPHSPVSQPDNGALKQEPAYETPTLEETPSKEEALNGIESKEALNGIESEEALNGVENLHPPHDAKDVEDLKLKVNNLEIKLKEAYNVITKVMDEKNVIIQERDKLHQEIVLLRTKTTPRIQGGFPFLFVVFIALVGVALGRLLLP